jgi:hypothetical protein
MATFIRFPVEGGASVLVNVDAIAYAAAGESGTRIVLRTETEDKLDVTTPFATVASMLNAQTPPP